MRQILPPGSSLQLLLLGERRLGPGRDSPDPEMPPLLLPGGRQPPGGRAVGDQQRNSPRCFSGLEVDDSTDSYSDTKLSTALSYAAAS